MFSGQEESNHSVGIKHELEREHDSERDFERSFDHDQSGLMKEESTMGYEDDDDHDRPSSADQHKESKFNLDLEGMSSDSNMFVQSKSLFPLLFFRIMFSSFIMFINSCYQYYGRAHAKGAVGS